MSVVTRRIFHISAASATLLNTQLCVEDSDDPDLGFRMWCGRDDVGIGPQTGTVAKFLAKDKAARVTQLEATSRVLVPSGADITASSITLTPTGTLDAIAGSAISLFSGGLYKASIVLHPSGNGQIRFADGRMVSNWTQDYCTLSDSDSETDQYKTDFGEVSIFAALHACISAASASAPATQVVYGTGSGITSSANMTFASDVLTLAGRFNVDKVSWGSPTTLSISSNTISPNFFTGKNIQVATITSGTGDIDNLGTLIAPAGTTAKNILIVCVNTDTSNHTIGGGTGWGNIEWEKNTNPSFATGLTVDSNGGAVVLELEYHYFGGSNQWLGKIWEYAGAPV